MRPPGGQREQSPEDTGLRLCPAAAPQSPEPVRTGGTWVRLGPHTGGRGDVHSPSACPLLVALCARGPDEPPLVSVQGLHPQEGDPGGRTPHIWETTLAHVVAHPALP